MDLPGDVAAVCAVSLLRTEPLASSLKHEKSHTLGVIVSIFATPIFQLSCAVIQDYASTDDYDVFVCNTDDNSDRETHYLNTLLSSRTMRRWTLFTRFWLAKYSVLSRQSASFPRSGPVLLRR